MSQLSRQKVENINNAKADVLSNTSGYRVMDLEILSGVIRGLKCPNSNTGCDGELLKGLAYELAIECQCGYSSQFYTSQSSSRQSFDINK